MDKNGTIKVVENKTLNSSPAKVQYSIGKQKRFADMRKSYCQEAFYTNSAQERNTI